MFIHLGKLSLGDRRRSGDIPLECHGTALPTGGHTGGIMVDRRKLITLCVAGALAAIAGPLAWADEDHTEDRRPPAPTPDTDADTGTDADTSRPTYGPPSGEPDEAGDGEDSGENPYAKYEKSQGRKAGRNRGRGLLGANVRVRGGSSSRTRIGGSIQIGK